MIKLHQYNINLFNFEISIHYSHKNCSSFPCFCSKIALLSCPFFFWSNALLSYYEVQFFFFGALYHIAQIIFNIQYLLVQIVGVWFFPSTVSKILAWDFISWVIIRVLLTSFQKTSINKLKQKLEIWYLNSLNMY